MVERVNCMEMHVVRKLEMGGKTTVVRIFLDGENGRPSRRIDASYSGDTVPTAAQMAEILTQLAEQLKGV